MATLDACFDSLGQYDKAIKYQEMLPDYRKRDWGQEGRRNSLWQPWMLALSLLASTTRLLNIRKCA